ncbi:MAG: hypothetical protein ABIJ48_10325 [Actinomycetota bacterium]
MPDDVAAGMASAGGLLEPAPADALALAKVGIPEALAAAQAQFSSPLTPAFVALALYSSTVTQEVGTQDRLVYVFVFDGLDLPPIGPYGGTGPTTVHHETVMLIDAITGEWILDTTFR